MKHKTQNYCEASKGIYKNFFFLQNLHFLQSFLIFTI